MEDLPPRRPQIGLTQLHKTLWLSHHTHTSILWRMDPRTYQLSFSQRKRNQTCTVPRAEPCTPPTPVAARNAHGTEHVHCVLRALRGLVSPPTYGPNRRLPSPYSVGTSLYLEDSDTSSKAPKSSPPSSDHIPSWPTVLPCPHPATTTRGTVTAYE